MSLIRPFERLGPPPFVLEGHFSFEDGRGELRPEVHLLQPFVAEDRRAGASRRHGYHYGLTFGYSDVDLIFVVGSVVQTGDRIELHGLVRRQDTFADIYSKFAASIFDKSSKRCGDAARICQY